VSLTPDPLHRTATSQPPHATAGSDGAPADAPCESCGESGQFERFELREMLFGLRELFPYLRCGACGLLRIEQVPSDLARHYPPEYYAGDPPPAAPPRGLLAARADRAANEVTLFGSGRFAARALRHWASPPARELRVSAPLIRRARLRSFGDPILDVGCGRVPGQLLRLRRLGFTNLLGVDPYLQEEIEYEGIQLRRRSIHEVEGEFQLVTLHHSFEHVPDPRETLRSASRLLRSGGVLLIRTPVMGTWFWETYGTSWWELDPPRHLFVFSQSSLERLAVDAGLTLIDVVWDSTPLEIIASEQIRRDIAWREPRSWNEAPPGIFDADFEAQAKAQVQQLNAEGRAGRAGFYFERTGHGTER
jgi:SAM-dependent methyltransferase